jgi:glycosyltransferase
MQRHPLVSVIVPVFNEEKRLMRCVASLRSQTYEKIEILLVDDGSTDATGRIADELARKYGQIRVFHTKNQGQGLAKNIGLEHAAGEYIGFVDADDFIENKMYEKMVEHALKSDAQIVQCSISRADENGSVFQKIYKPSKEVWVTDRGAFFRDWISYGDFSHGCCNKLYQTDFLDRYRIRFRSNQEVYYEDLLFNLEAAYHLKKLVSLSECYYYYTYTRNSYSQSVKPGNSEKILRLFACFLRKIDSCGDEILIYEVKNLALKQICLVFSRVIRERDGRLSMRKLMKTEQMRDYLKALDSPMSPPYRRRIGKMLRFLPYPLKYVYLYGYFRKRYEW